MFVLGVFVELERRAHRTLDNTLSLPVALILFIGLFVAISAIAGMYGTVKEKPLMLRLVLILCLEGEMVLYAPGLISQILSPLQRLGTSSIKD